MHPLSVWMDAPSVEEKEQKNKQNKKKNSNNKQLSTNTPKGNEQSDGMHIRNIPFSLLYASLLYVSLHTF
jgi:hypothetical protein